MTYILSKLYCFFIVVGCDYDDLYDRLFSSYPRIVEVNAQYVSRSALLAFASYPRLELKTIDMELKCAGKRLLLPLLGRCPYLTSLTLSGQFWRKTDEDVRVIVERCPLLNTLCLAGSSEVTDLSISYISLLEHLAELDISALYSVDTDGPGVTSEGLQSLVKARPSILVLKCKIEEGCVDTLLRRVGIYCMSLTVLHVKTGSEIYAATHGAVIALIQGCPLLQELDLDEYSPSDDVLYALAECCPRLMGLNTFLYEPAGFTDRGLVALSRGCPGLTQLHMHDAAGITDEAIMSFAEHCRKLESIALSNNRLVTSEAMCALLKANPGITAMEVSECTLLDDNVILTIAQYCPRVKLLSMFSCQRLSIESLYTLARSCRSLHEVSIADSTITDAFISLLTQYSKGLKSIDLSECPNITEHTLVTLLESGKHLTHIYIDECALYAIDKLCRYYESTDRDPGTHTRQQPSQGWLTRLYESIHDWIVSATRPRREGRVGVAYYVNLWRAHRRAPWS